MTNIITAAFVAGAIVIGNNPGGRIDHFVHKVYVAKQSRVPVMFNGRCYSACTLYLSLPSNQLCLTPTAEFGFHLPHGGTKKQIQTAAGFMLGLYPKWVQTWINNHGGLSSQIKTMPADYAARYIGWC